MKKRIEKLISEYEEKARRCRTEIKALQILLSEEQLRQRKESDALKAVSIAFDVEHTRRDLRVQQKKLMILVQSRTDFESLLMYCKPKTK